MAVEGVGFVADELADVGRDPRQVFLEAARACGEANRNLDGDLLFTAVRQADLLLQLAELAETRLDDPTAAIAACISVIRALPPTDWWRNNRRRRYR